VYVVICGSRYWTDRERIKSVLYELPSDAVVIHGAARGVDTIAGEEAKALELSVIGVPADWDGYGKSAGGIRNQQMLEMLLRARFWADDVLVIAFHEDPNLGKGTRDMVRRAREANIEVKIYGPIV
jgi:hypothetical protein